MLLQVHPNSIRFICSFKCILIRYVSYAPSRCSWHHFMLFPVELPLFAWFRFLILKSPFLPVPACSTSCQPLFTSVSLYLCLHDRLLCPCLSCLRARACLSVCLHGCVSEPVSLLLPVCLFVCPCLSVCAPVPVCLSVCPCLSVCVPVPLSLAAYLMLRLSRLIRALSVVHPVCSATDLATDLVSKRQPDRDLLDRVPNGLIGAAERRHQRGELGKGQRPVIQCADATNADRAVGPLKCVCTQVGRQMRTGMKAGRQADRKTAGTQADRKTESQAGRKAWRQTGRAWKQTRAQEHRDEGGKEADKQARGKQPASTQSRQPCVARPARYASADVLPQCS